MEQILKTTMLEYEKSTFLIDLVKHKSGADYINIRQTITDKQQTQELKVNLSVAVDLIYILQKYMEDVSQSGYTSKSYFSEEKQKQIIDRYYKGISLSDLAIQFDCKQEIIEQILFNKGIEIVDNKMPAHLKTGRRNTNRKPRTRRSRRK